MDVGQPQAAPTPPSEEELQAPEPSGREAGPEPTPEELPLRRQLARPESETQPAPRGLSDILQEAMSAPDRNAALPGEISLSTTAWEYAPWVQAFRRAVEERWHAPIAYQLGMISGWTRVVLVIERSGELRSLEVVGQEVDHRSLTDAVVYALEEAAPYRPLPAHFPDETLELTIRFVYPGPRR
jgi:hypothetical protein